MTELSRNLLAAARDGLSPEAEVAARVRARVAAAVGAPIAAAATAPAKATGVSLALKLAVLAGVVIVAARAAVVLSSSTPAAAPKIVVPATEPSTPSVAMHTASEPSIPSMAMHTASEPSTPSIVTHARDAITLARENELVDRAMRSLHAGNAAAALEATDTYEREARGAGQLAEEAAALAIEARCTLHVDVAARRARFERAWPSSSQSRHIAAACP